MMIINIIITTSFISNTLKRSVTPSLFSSQCTDRAILYCFCNYNTVSQKLNKESKEESILWTSEEKRKCSGYENVNIDDFGRAVNWRHNWAIVFTKKGNTNLEETSACNCKAEVVLKETGQQSDEY